MEKAVIYFNYFAFQTSSNIFSFEAIHPKVWHWLKKHLNEALDFGVSLNNLGLKMFRLFCVID